MTFETICDIFSGNTEEVKKSRKMDVLVATNYPYPANLKVVNVTMSVNGQIVLITEET